MLDGVIVPLDGVAAEPTLVSTVAAIDKRTIAPIRIFVCVSGEKNVTTEVDKQLVWFLLLRIFFSSSDGAGVLETAPGIVVLPTIISVMDGFVLKSDIALLCATSVFSVSLWLMNSEQKHTTETQRTQRLHREISEVMTSLFCNQRRCHRPDLYWTKAKVDRLNDVNSALRDRRFEHRYAG